MTQRARQAIMADGHGTERPTLVCTAENAVSSKRLPSVLVPESFNPLKLLPLKLLPCADGVKWFLGTIVKKAMYGRADEDGFVRLQAGIIRHMVGPRTWPQMWRALEGMIETSSHVAGLRCRGYRLGEQLIGPIRRVQLVEPRIVSRMAAFRDEYRQFQEARMLPIHRQLREMQKLLTIAPGADLLLARLSDRSRQVQTALVEAIRQHRAGFSVSATGRVFNAITGLARPLRPFVRLAGEPIVGVDISGAQPAMLGLIFRSNGLKGATSLCTPSLVAVARVSACRCASVCSGSCLADRLVSCFDFVRDCMLDFDDDASDYASLSIDGVFYEMLLDLCRRRDVKMPEGDLARGWVKKRLFVDVLICAGEYPSSFAMVFRERFPSVSNFIRAANAGYRGMIISALQAMEAALVIQNVAPKLVERVPVITLHDAIYCRERDRTLVRDAFAETFEELGFTLKLKDE